MHENALFNSDSFSNSTREKKRPCHQELFEFIMTDFCIALANAREHCVMSTKKVCFFLFNFFFIFLIFPSSHCYETFANLSSLTLTSVSDVTLKFIQTQSYKVIKTNL